MRAPGGLGARVRIPEQRLPGQARLGDLLLAGQPVAGGNPVEIIGRDPAKTEDLAATLGGGATTGTFGAAPAGDIVILAVPSASAVPVVAQYGNALAGKVIIDITNPMKADASGLTTAAGTSAAQEIAKAAPANAPVVKAFNTVPGDGANLWNAVHARDLAALFRLALEKGPAGRYWHAVNDGAIPFRDIAEAIGARLGLPAVSVPLDELVLPGYG
ncbi:MAG: NAD(P)-binding domain-containing protein [Actinoplanes sp.]